MENIVTTLNGGNEIPSREERLQELKLYYLVCQDATVSAQELLSAIGHATLGLQHAARNDPRFAAYLETPLRPKVTLKARNAEGIARAGRECAAAGIPFSYASIYQAADVLCLGPVLREDLPPFIAKHHLLACEAPPCISFPADEDRPSLRVIVRQDIDMPAGKLVVQAGHALFDVMHRMKCERPEDFALWLLDGCPIDIRPTIGTSELEAAEVEAAGAGILSALVVDQGRTVFNGETMTAGGFYPLLPEVVFPSSR